MEEKNENIENDNELDKKQLNFKLFISQIIISIILLIIIIICFLNTKRIILFSYLIFNNNFIIPLMIFITSILGFLCTTTISLFYYFFKENKNYLKNLINIYKKIDLIKFVDLLLCFLFFIIVFIITPCNVEGDSMNDTLKSKDKIITTDLFYNEPNIGDIVTFDCSNYTNSDPRLYIKRILAKNGSKINYDSHNMTILINDKEEIFDVTSKEYAIIYLTSNDIYDIFELNKLKTEEILSFDIKDEFYMPKNKALVFGDNRANSMDSDDFGAISTKDIFGHVLFRIGKKIEENILY